LTYKNNNAVAFLGREYTLLIDGFEAKAAPQALTAAGRLSLNPVRFIVNTHHHKDHTGGNDFFSDSGVHVLLHEQVYNNIWSDVNEEVMNRLKTQRAELSKVIKSAGKTAKGEELSVKYNKLSEQNIERSLSYSAMTFSDNFRMNLGNETIDFKNVSKAHTSLDVYAYFQNNNVLATGDLFFNGKYPFIDEDFKGSMEGYINAIDKMLALCNNDTVIVPGHGPIASKSDLESYKRMLEYTQKGVQMDYLLGKTLEEVLANKAITANFDAQGYGMGYVKTQEYVSMLYRAAEKRYPRKK
jgi:glyoxylase-like metal-dependent hydrolase (beta-lactamase superfamily II)